MENMMLDFLAIYKNIKKTLECFSVKRINCYYYIKKYMVNYKYLIKNKILI